MTFATTPGTSGRREDSTIPEDVPGRVSGMVRAASPCRSVMPMPMFVHHERDNIYRVVVRGTLRKGDLERSQDQLLGEMARTGPVRLLFVLDGFDGWESGTGWNDLSFYVTHGDRIERIAIVGPERWRSETLMFAGADLRKAPVEFFHENADADARTWLSS
jgi:hypothetical protein